MNIAVILSSPNQPSNSAYLANSFIEGVVSVAPESTITIFNTHTLALAPFSLECYEETYIHEPLFTDFAADIMAADAILIATPIWNYGVPGTLKNTIDRMGSFAFNRATSKGLLAGKPLFTIFTGGAPAVAWQFAFQKTTSFIVESLRYFGATPIGNYFEPLCTKGKGQFGLVVDTRPQSLSTVKNLGVQFAKTVSTYKNTGKLPLKEKWYGIALKTGEKILKKITG